MQFTTAKPAHIVNTNKCFCDRFTSFCKGAGSVEAGFLVETNCIADNSTGESYWAPICEKCVREIEASRERVHATYTVFFPAGQKPALKKTRKITHAAPAPAPAPAESIDPFAALFGSQPA